MMRLSLLSVLLLGAGSQAIPSLMTTVAGSQGVNLSVMESGSAQSRSIIFIHGFLSDKAVWRKQFASPALSSFHLVAYDWRGSGASEKPTDASAYASPQVWAEDLKAVITSTRSVKPVLVAWSMGSNIVIDYLQRYGDAGLSGVVLIGSSLNAGDPVTQAQFLPDGQQVLRNLFTADPVASQQAGQAFVRALTVSDQGPELSATLLEAVNTVPLPVKVALASQAPIDPRPILSTLRVPILLMQGAQDRFLTPAMLTHNAELLNHPVTALYPDSGHAVQLDAPEQFNDALIKFLAP